MTLLAIYQMEQNNFDNFIINSESNQNENEQIEQIDTFLEDLGTGQQFNQTDDLFDQIVYRPGEYSVRQLSREESSPKMECSYHSPPPPLPSITTAEVVHNPPPSYDAIASESKVSPPRVDTSVQIVTTTAKRTYRPSTSRVRSGPYEKYKDESGKIRVEQIIDPNEREKVLEKREKNRVAAEKARYKKKERIDTLETEKKRLDDLIKATDDELSKKRRYLDLLKVSFQEHEKVCHFFTKKIH